MEIAFDIFLAQVIKIRASVQYAGGLILQFNVLL